MGNSYEEGGLSHEGNLLYVVKVLSNNGRNHFCRCFNLKNLQLLVTSYNVSPFFSFFGRFWSG